MDLSHKFSADRPITSAAEDKLGRATFANAIAKAIAGWKSKDSLVVALYGPWGTGKSSLKEMALEALRNQKVNMDVLEFNPWQFSGSNLQAPFFRDLGVTLGHGTQSDDSKGLVAKLEMYAGSLQLTSEVARGMHRLLRGILIVLIFLTGVSVGDLFRANRTLVILMSAFAIGLEWLLGVSERITRALAKLEATRSKAAEKTTAEQKMGLS